MNIFNGMCEQYIYLVTADWYSSASSGTYKVKYILYNITGVANKYIYSI